MVFDVNLPRVSVLTASVSGVHTSRCYLVAVAHLSRQSVEDVRRAVASVKPHVVALELCEARRGMLRPPPPPSAGPPPGAGELLRRVRAGDENPFAAVYSALLAHLGEAMETPPGAEFRAAAEAAAALGARVELVDRPVRVTLDRLWASLGLWERVRLVCGLLRLALADAGSLKQELAELCDDEDAVTAQIRELARDFPSVGRVLIDERDRYMAAQLQALATAEPGRRVLMVVGAGHVPGVKRAWGGGLVSESEVESLSAGPSGGRRWGLRLLGAAVVVGVGVGVWRVGSRRGWRLGRLRR